MIPDLAACLGPTTTHSCAPATSAGLYQYHICSTALYHTLHHTALTALYLPGSWFVYTKTTLICCRLNFTININNAFTLHFALSCERGKGAGVVGVRTCTFLQNIPQRQRSRPFHWRRVQEKWEIILRATGKGRLGKVTERPLNFKGERTEKKHASYVNNHHCPLILLLNTICVKWKLYPKLGFGLDHSLTRGYHNLTRDRTFVCI